MHEFIPEVKSTNPTGLWFAIPLFFVGLAIGILGEYFFLSASVAKLKNQALSISLYEAGYKTIAVYNGFLAEGGTVKQWEDRGTRVRAWDEYSKRFHKNITEIYIPNLLQEIQKSSIQGDWKDFSIDETVD